MNGFISVEIMILKSELEDQIKNQTATIASDIEKIIGKGLVNFGVHIALLEPNKFSLFWTIFNR